MKFINFNSQKFPFTFDLKFHQLFSKYFFCLIKNSRVSKFHAQNCTKFSTAYENKKNYISLISNLKLTNNFYDPKKKYTNVHFYFCIRYIFLINFFYDLRFILRRVPWEEKKLRVTCGCVYPYIWPLHMYLCTYKNEAKGMKKKKKIGTCLAGSLEHFDVFFFTLLSIFHPSDSLIYVQI